VRNLIRLLTALILAIVVSATSSLAQHETTQCQGPSIPTVRRSSNFFTDEQENELGRVIGAQTQLSVKVIDDPDLTGYLAAIGARLEAHMPPTGLHFHYYVVEMPEANAFSIPGGYIYVSRKLVAFMRSEDELAAVLGHEMGHIVTHQGAIQMTRMMRELLTVDHIQTSEIFDRFNQVLENWRKKPSVMSGTAEAEQNAADKISIFALAASGYPPQTMADFFDRLVELKGKKGNWFSDVFGTANPNGKRMREALKNLSQLNQACRNVLPCATTGSSSPGCASKIATRQEEFKDWQEAVSQYNGIGHKESLHAVTMRKKLQPALRSDLERLRISPDGKYLLAQDEGGIAIFSRNKEKLDRLFWIDAENAKPAQFTPDSRYISFFIHSPFGSPHVEVWDVVEHTSDVYEVHDPSSCVKSLLSPDGKTFVCIAMENEFSWMTGISYNLRIRRVEDNELLFEKKRFYSDGGYTTLGLFSFGRSQEYEVVHTGFSPDGRYLLLGQTSPHELALGIDLSTGKTLNLDGNVRRLLHEKFVFMDDHRIAGREGDHGQVVSFPEGTVLFDNLKIGNAHIDSVAHGDFLVLRPLKNSAAGVLDLKENITHIGVKRPALDVYDTLFISERDDGQLGIRSTSDGKEVNFVPMIESQLSALRADAISPDLNWIALSGKTRGAVWNVPRNERIVHVRGFYDAWLGDDSTLYAYFPAQGETKRSIVHVNLATSPPAFTPRETEADVQLGQVDRYLMVSRPEKKGDLSHNVTLEVHDVRDDKLLWSRLFSHRPNYRFFNRDTGSLVMAWALVFDEAKKSLRNDPAWRGRIRDLNDDQGMVAAEVLDAATGTVRTRVVLDTGKGSFMPVKMFATADRLFILDNMQRLLAYSFDGKLQGRAFGRSGTASPDGRFVLLETARGRLAVLDSATLTPLDQLDFASPIAITAFAGGSLAVLAADQTFYIFDLKQLAQKPASIPN